MGSGDTNTSKKKFETLRVNVKFEYTDETGSYKYKVTSNSREVACRKDRLHRTPIDNALICLDYDTITKTYDIENESDMTTYKRDMDYEQSYVEPYSTNVKVGVEI